MTRLLAVMGADRCDPHAAVVVWHAEQAPRVEVIDHPDDCAYSATSTSPREWDARLTLAGPVTALRSAAACAAHTVTYG